MAVVEEFGVVETFARGCEVEEARDIEVGEDEEEEVDGQVEDR
jgi:hypothetical protein